MRKRIVSPALTRETTPDVEWLDLDGVASVEVTSEDPEFPVEDALVECARSGWRALAPGEQTLRLLFDAPRRLTRIAIDFVEEDVERAHEFVISWSPGDEEYREVVRQQWNFSPNGSTRESEDYRVDLDAVRALEITIRPDLTHLQAVASISRLRLAGPSL